VRLAGIGPLAGGVTAALYVAGRLHTPNYTASLFGQSGLGAIALKSVLTTSVLGLAALQGLRFRGLPAMQTSRHQPPIIMARGSGPGPRRPRSSDVSGGARRALS
jgi:hypothetical protein